MLVQKYAKALLTALKNDDEIVEVYEALARISLVAKDPKFLLVVKSPSLTQEEKIEFLLELGESKNEHLKNFLKIVLENKREDLLKEIFQIVYQNVARHFNTYAGVVEGKVSQEVLEELEEKLSKKLNATIKLQLKEKDINGIKVYVDVLNVEVSIDENKIKNDLINQILKAI